MAVDAAKRKNGRERTGREIREKEIRDAKSNADDKKIKNRAGLPPDRKMTFQLARLLSSYRREKNSAVVMRMVKSAGNQTVSLFYRFVFGGRSHHPLQ
jgi:hypothetical protein